MPTLALYCALTTTLIGCPAPSDAAAGAGARGESATALRDCERYRNTIPDAFEWCVISEARSVRDVEAMTELCAHAGEMVRDCHYYWVDARRGAFDLQPDTLLAACGPSADCALQILDAFPDPDVVAQIARCEASGRFRGYCAGHAVRRWAEGHPDAAEIARALAGANDEVLGRAVGEMVACRGVGACPDDHSAAAGACAREIASRVSHPRECRVPEAARRAPIPHPMP